MSTRTSAANFRLQSDEPSLLERLKETVTGEYAPHIIAIIASLLFLAYWFLPRSPVRPVAVHLVRGQVLLDGEPVADAGIVLHAVNRSDIGLPGNVDPHGRTDSDGAFVLETFAADDGAPNGEYIATIIKVEEKTDPDGETSFGPNKLPAVYGRKDGSPFKITISDDVEELETFNLISKGQGGGGNNSSKGGRSVSR